MEMRRKAAMEAAAKGKSDVIQEEGEEEEKKIDSGDEADEMEWAEEISGGRNTYKKFMAASNGGPRIKTVQKLFKARRVLTCATIFPLFFYSTQFWYT